MCDHGRIATGQVELPLDPQEGMVIPMDVHACRILASLAMVILVVVPSAPAGLGQESAAPVTEPAADVNPMLHGALPWEVAEDAEEMVVHSVTDGDTVRLTYPNDDWYHNTRLIGVQAPEMDGPFTDEQCYGPEARDFLSELLPVGAAVYAQQDVSDEDRNGRRLRHVFMIDEETGGAYLVSEVLILGGFAVARSYLPDDLYDDVLAEAQAIAEREDDGLWEACPA